jgi:hypothetical protein
LISVGSVLSRLDKFTTFQPGDRPTRNQSLAILAQITVECFGDDYDGEALQAHRGQFLAAGDERADFLDRRDSH